MRILNSPSLLTRFVGLFVILASFSGSLVVILIDYARGIEPPLLLVSLVSSLIPASTYALGLQQGVPLSNGETSNAIKKIAASLHSEGQHVD